MPDQSTEHEKFDQYVQASAVQLAWDLVRVLNKGVALSVAVHGDLDDDGALFHMVEWAFDGARYSLEVAWDSAAKRYAAGEVKHW